MQALQHLNLYPSLIYTKISHSSRSMSNAFVKTKYNEVLIQQCDNFYTLQSQKQIIYRHFGKIIQFVVKKYLEVNVIIFD